MGLGIAVGEDGRRHAGGETRYLEHRMTVWMYPVPTPVAPTGSRMLSKSRRADETNTATVCQSGAVLA